MSADMFKSLPCGEQDDDLSSFRDGPVLIRNGFEQEFAGLCDSLLALIEDVQHSRVGKREIVSGLRAVFIHCQWWRQYWLTPDVYITRPFDQSEAGFSLYSQRKAVEQKSANK